MSDRDLSFVFFGTPELAVTVLEELKAEGLIPKLIVTAPDRRQGRGMKLTPPPVKIWADKENIEVIQPASLIKDNLAGELSRRSPEGGWHLFALAAYGKIIPEEILAIPEKGTLNVHPSLLPKHRGPSPIESQILSDDPDTGVSIMLLDEEMDHGPILAQTSVSLDDWPAYASELESVLATEGGKLLAYILPRWVNGEIDPVEQDHKSATYCSLIKKSDGEINPEGDPRETLLKIRAYNKWPRAFFLDKKGRRIVVTRASSSGKGLNIERVIPEGKSEMSYEDYLKNTN